VHRYSPTLALLASAACLLTHASAQANGSIEKGKGLYVQHCAACHSVDYNGAGPAHAGVFGRKAGSVANFAYSPALKASKLVWTEATLNQWLADPEKLIPGQKMWMKVEEATERQDLVAYLKALNKK
jgi:cytochrome c